MQSQFLEKENNSEEIYRRMIEEIFDDPEVEKNYSGSPQKTEDVESALP